MSKSALRNDGPRALAPLAATATGLPGAREARGEPGTVDRDAERAEAARAKLARLAAKAALAARVRAPRSETDAGPPSEASGISKKAPQAFPAPRPIPAAIASGVTVRADPCAVVPRRGKGRAWSRGVTVTAGVVLAASALVAPSVGVALVRWLPATSNLPRSAATALTNDTVRFAALPPASFATLTPPSVEIATDGEPARDDKAARAATMSGTGPVVPGPIPSPIPGPKPSPVPSPVRSPPVPGPVPSPIPGPVPSPVPGPERSPVPGPAPSPPHSPPGPAPEPGPSLPIPRVPIVSVSPAALPASTARPVHPDLDDMSVHFSARALDAR